MSEKVSILIFYRDGFGIKWPTKIDMQLKKETKPNFHFRINTHGKEMNPFILKAMCEIESHGSSIRMVMESNNSRGLICH